MKHIPTNMTYRRCWFHMHSCIMRLSVTVATASHVLRPRLAPNCVRDVESRSSCSNGSLAVFLNALPLWFRRFKYRQPFIGSVPSLSCFRSLKISPEKNSSGTHPLSRNNWKQSDNPLATSSDTLPPLQRADLRSLCFSRGYSSSVHPCCSAVFRFASGLSLH